MDLAQHVDILAYNRTRITFDATAQLVWLSHMWDLLLRSFRLQLMGVVCWLAHPLGPAAISVELVAKLLPHETFRGLTDPLAPTCNAALGIREASFATAGPQLTQEISSCVPFQQGDLSHTCCNSVKCIRYTIVMVNQHIDGI